MGTKVKKGKVDDVKKTFVSGIAKINFDKRKVDIIFPNKKITYMANGCPREYANYSMIFNCETQEEADKYASVLVGLEFIPAYCHADAEVASEVYKIVVEALAKKLDGIEPRGDDDSDISDDERALLEEEIQSLLQ